MPCPCRPHSCRHEAHALYVRGSRAQRAPLHELVEVQTRHNERQLLRLLKVKEEEHTLSRSGSPFTRSW